jgi:hypothetical protein
MTNPIVPNKDLETRFTGRIRRPCCEDPSCPSRLSIPLVICQKVIFKDTKLSLSFLAGGGSLDLLAKNRTLEKFRTPPLFFLIGSRFPGFLMGIAVDRFLLKSTIHCSICLRTHEHNILLIKLFRNAYLFSLSTSNLRLR